MKDSSARHVYLTIVSTEEILEQFRGYDDEVAFGNHTNEMVLLNDRRQATRFERIK